MRIKKMCADFGNLTGAELTLEPGLNVITAPNESGKSTWCAFIRAMLYGVKSSERAKAGYLPDKQRYAPWSGAPMSGTMDLFHNGQDITLRRSTRTANAPMREFSAVYTGTEERVPGLTGENAGEALTGVSQEVFRRSAFIGQGDVAVSGTPELEKRIAAIVSTGEEESAYSEIDAKLRKWQRRRRHNKSGAIPELKRQIDEQEALLAGLSGSAAERDRRSAELENLRAEIEAVKRQISDAAERGREASTARLAALRERERELEGEKSAAAEAAAAKEAQTQIGPFAGKTPEAAAAEAEDAVERAESIRDGSKKKLVRNRVMVLSFILVGVLLVFIVSALMKAPLWELIMLAALAAVVAALIALTASGKIRGVQLRTTARSEYDDLLTKYGAYDPSGIYAAADLHAERWREAETAKNAVVDSTEKLQAAREKLEAEQTRIVAGAQSEDEARLTRRLAELEAQAAYASTALSELSGAMGVSGDPMAIESGILEAKGRLAELNAQYAAISLAVETLRDAESELQSRFSPALAKRAAEYFARMTKGRYSELSLARDFSATARLSGDAVPHEADYLSAGATDLLYLAVRLAVCELALPGDEPCPIVLDDALTNLDPEREAAAMELLREIAQKRQVILFKCR